MPGPEIAGQRDEGGEPDLVGEFQPMTAGEREQMELAALAMAAEFLAHLNKWRSPMASSGEPREP